MPRQIKCRVCGKSKQHYANGMCRKCYNVEYQAEYRANNRDRIAEYKAEHYQQNRDRIAEQQAEYRANNRDRQRWHSFNKNSKQRGYDGAITFDEYLTLKSQTTCFYCGCELGKHPADGLDHFIHHTHGGRTELDNLVPACYKCNNTKQDKLAIHINLESGKTGWVFVG